MTANFTLNRAGLGEVLRSRELVAALTVEAAKIEARAKATSRVESPASARRHHRLPGKFERSIHLETHRGPTRTTVRVVADCDGAAAIEARDGTLGRAAG
jgi:hypothetical protein